MKDAALHVLITARSLLEQATILCSSNERHAATAGLIVLQDATELFFLGALLELGTDEAEKIESFDFDQMMGSLKKSGVTVPKTGTLKAMNKLRVALGDQLIGNRQECQLLHIAQLKHLVRKGFLVRCIRSKPKSAMCHF